MKECKKISPRLNPHGAYEYKGMKAIPWRHATLENYWLVMVLFPWPKEEDVPFHLKTEEMIEKEEEEGVKGYRLPHHYCVLAETPREAAKEGYHAYYRNLCPDPKDE